MKTQVVSEQRKAELASWFNSAMVALLERTDIGSVEMPDNQTIAEEAKQVLGYKGMAKQETSARLLRALTKIGFMPYTSESVDAYMELKLEEKYEDPIESGLMSKVTTAAQVCLILSAVGLFVCAFAASLHSYPAWASVLLSCSLWTLGCLLSIVIFNNFYGYIIDAKMEEMQLWKWQFVDLCKFKEPVPKEVVMLAIELKKQIPYAHFEVCELIKPKVLIVQKSEFSFFTQKVQDDPFLVITDKKYNTSYFIAVWDETYKPEQMV
ncbi:MAG: hypothetical protein WCP93_02530 [Candidatus Berkelbacteria bacterium]